MDLEKEKVRICPDVKWTCAQKRPTDLMSTRLTRTQGRHYLFSVLEAVC